MEEEMPFHKNQSNFESYTDNFCFEENKKAWNIMFLEDKLLLIQIIFKKHDVLTPNFLGFLNFFE